MIVERCIVMFVKLPREGEVKTRLAADLAGGFVVSLYEAFVADLTAVLRRSGHPFRLAFTPPDRGDEIAARFGDCPLIPQEGADLGERLKNAFQRSFADGYDRVVIIGSDSPDLPEESFSEAFRALDRRDAVIGPAADGGYYLIGFRKETFSPVVFDGIAWGTEQVFGQTMAHLKRAGRSVRRLPVRRDVDTPDDLRALLERHRDTPFAASRTMACLKAHGRR
ncbi:MAG: TIGR04282 family arsenosugar biosynthesis glycosyltransferase [Deltaproteobacteria bacterium]|nr:TIGR04282 family arsenosugar biosynthesis glycosyltransferase [Deltaproteobacteria bacterium]